MSAILSTCQTARARLEACGVKNRVQLAVVEMLSQAVCPMSQVEVWRRMGEGRGLSTITSRFAELRILGVIEVKGRRKCSVTGQDVKVWGWTGRDPVKPVAPLSTKEQLRNALRKIEELEAALHRRRDGDGKFAKATKIEDPAQPTLL